MKNILFFMLFIIFFSCTSEKVDAKFIEIKNNIARFDITNNSDEDIAKIKYELRFFDSTKKLILRDTVSYKMSNDDKNIVQPFLKANQETFVVNETPVNCEKVEIKILEVDYMK